MVQTKNKLKEIEEKISDIISGDNYIFSDITFMKRKGVSENEKVRFTISLCDTPSVDNFSKYIREVMDAAREDIDILELIMMDEEMNNDHSFMVVEVPSIGFSEDEEKLKEYVLKNIRLIEL